MHTQLNESHARADYILSDLATAHKIARKHTLERDSACSQLEDLRNDLLHSERRSADLLRATHAQQHGELQALHEQYHDELQSARAELDSTRARSALALAERDSELSYASGQHAKQQARIQELVKEVKKHKTRETRSQRARYVSTIKFKAKGSLALTVRLAIVKLVGAGVSFGRVCAVITICAELMRVRVVGSFVRETVRRVMLEALVVCKLKVVDELQRNKSESCICDAS
jgi:hypothetical protein